MKKIHKLILPILLGATAAGVFIFINRPTLSGAMVDREVPISRSAVGPNNQLDPINKNPKNASAQKRDEDGKALVKRAPESNPVALILRSEKSLVTEVEGNPGVDARASTSLMVGNQFHDFMEHLSLESTSTPLAQDITNLYSNAAAEANSSVDGKVNVKIACGMVVCGVSATAPTREAFDAWFEAFTKNKSAPPYAAGRFDKTLDDGSTEYRLIFSTDPQKNSVIMHPQ